MVRQASFRLIQSDDMNTSLSSAARYHRIEKPSGGKLSAVPAVKDETTTIRAGNINVK
jgi:hypothetical protein